MKRFALLLAAMLIASPAFAQQKDPALNLAVKLKILTPEKLQAALDDAEANGDPYSPECYRALMPVVAAAATARATATPIARGGDINLILAYQKARDFRRAAQTIANAVNGGGNTDLVRACAPMAMDSESVINKIILDAGALALIPK